MIVSPSIFLSSPRVAPSPHWVGPILQQPPAEAQESVLKKCSTARLIIKLLGH